MCNESTDCEYVVEPTIHQSKAIETSHKPDLAKWVDELFRKLEEGSDGQTSATSEDAKDGPNWIDEIFGSDPPQTSDLTCGTGTISVGARETLNVESNHALALPSDSKAISTTEPRFASRKELLARKQAGKLILRGFQWAVFGRAWSDLDTPEFEQLPKWFTKNAIKNDIARVLSFIGYHWITPRPNLSQLTRYLNQNRDLLQPENGFYLDQRKEIRRSLSRKFARKIKSKQVSAKPLQNETAEVVQLSKSSDLFLNRLSERSVEVLNRLRECTLENPCSVIGCDKCSQQRQQQLVDRIGSIVKRTVRPRTPISDYRFDLPGQYRGHCPYFVTITVADSNFEIFEAFDQPNPWRCTAEQMPAVIESMSEVFECLETSPSHKGAFIAVDIAPPDRTNENGHLIIRENADILHKLRNAPKNYRALSAEQIDIHLRLLYQLHLHCIVIDRETMNRLRLMQRN